MFSQGLKDEFEIAVVNEPSVFKPLKFYCSNLLQPKTMFVTEAIFLEGSMLETFTNQYATELGDFECEIANVIVNKALGSWDICWHASFIYISCVFLPLILCVFLPLIRKRGSNTQWQTFTKDTQARRSELRALSQTGGHSAPLIENSSNIYFTYFGHIGFAAGRCWTVHILITTFTPNLSERIHGRGTRGRASVPYLFRHPICQWRSLKFSLPGKNGKIG